MSVVSNVVSLAASQTLGRTNDALQTAQRRLASGLRITTAADDAASLVISERLRSQASGMGQAVRNASDGISVLQIADGALGETTNLLQHMRDLAIQANNSGAVDSNGLSALQKELTRMGEQVDQISAATNFDGIPLLDGSYDRLFQVGANAGETIRVTIPANGVALNQTGLGIAGIDVTTGGAGAAVTALDNAIGRVSLVRADLGGVENRFEHTVVRLRGALADTAASESRLRDADMAQESAEVSRSQMLVQAGTAMLAQANQAPQTVMKLLAA